MSRGKVKLNVMGGGGHRYKPNVGGYEIIFTNFYRKLSKFECQWNSNEQGS